jgi:hypothetical protein
MPEVYFNDMIGTRNPVIVTVVSFAAISLIVGYNNGFSFPHRTEVAPLGVPSVAAVAKGPNQINLTWSGVPNPGYGYLVEIQSSDDSRYSSWIELQPVPRASGYNCDNTIVWNGGFCNISDPSGIHVYNPRTNGIPPWVTDANYIDPGDGSAVQFLASGLRSNTTYHFRVRSYSERKSFTYGGYSNTATATTAKYSLRFVSPAGNDSNDGSRPESSHAWRTLSHATGTISCGQELIVSGGSYNNDSVNMGQRCSAEKKAVVMVSPGEIAIITSVPSGANQALLLSGSYIVVDGMVAAAASSMPGEYVGVVAGNHDALLNVEVHPPVVPTFRGGVMVYGDHNLLYHSYLHDYGSPDATQNPAGNSGFILAVYGKGATNNVIWSNHLTRGGHDESLCKAGCSYNRWLNNVMDGGWGQGWNAVYGDNAVSEHNLVEGNFIYDIGRLVSFFKPSIQLSQGNNTVRRNIVVNGKSSAVEESYLYGGTAANNLVYNNVFYNHDSCFFQSSNGGITAYNNDVFVNNICDRLHSLATNIYLDNTTNQISYNDLLYADAAGKRQPTQPIIIWNHNAQGSYQYPQPLSYADRNYSPPFSHNRGLDVNPEFVDEAHFDFHLMANSPLIGAGTEVMDAQWGSTDGTADLGAFGINVSQPRSSSVAPAAKYTVPNSRLLEWTILDKGMGGVLATFRAEH